MNLVNVAGLDFSDPSFAYFTCNVLDPDGRSNNPILSGFLLDIAGIRKMVPSARFNLGFHFDMVVGGLIHLRIIYRIFHIAFYRLDPFYSA